MVRGSTDKIIITIDDLSENVTDLRATIAQEDVKITKSLEDVTIEEKTVTIPLSQEDTLKLNKGRAKVQVKWTDGEIVGNTIASQIYLDEDYDGRTI